jgi:hypothetical protein
MQESRRNRMEASDGEPRHRSILLSYYSLPACLVLVIKGSGTKSSCCAWCCELTVDRLREDAGLSLFLQALVVVPTREFGIQVTAAAYRVASLIALLQGHQGCQTNRSQGLHRHGSACILVDLCLCQCLIS